MKSKEWASTTRVGHLHNGQVSIPVDFQEAIGARSDDLLEMQVVDDEIRLKLAGTAAMSVSNTWVRELYDYFAPIRAEAEAAGLSDDEINEAIDEALRAVRSEQR